MCKSKNHTKRKCPDKNKEVEQPPKRGRGRPKKVVEVSPTLTTEVNSTVTAQPSTTRRGGRVIRGGKGSRGGGRGSGRGGAGRGGSGRVVAVEVMLAEVMVVLLEVEGLG